MKEKTKTKNYKKCDLFPQKNRFRFDLAGDCKKFSNQSNVVQFYGNIGPNEPIRFLYYEG